jgi:hypothetical protein
VVCVMDTGSEKYVAVLSQMLDDSATHMKPAGECWHIERSACREVPHQLPTRWKQTAGKSHGTAALHVPSCCATSCRGSCQRRCGLTIHQQRGRVLELLDVSDAALDGGRDARAQQHGAQELADAGQDDHLAQRERLGADRGRKTVGPAHLTMDA